MFRPAPKVSALHRPGEVAELLGCSEWWVKEQARKRRIPYTWIGGSYRFTDEHVAEIVRLFEVKPTEVAALSPAPRQRAANTDGAKSKPSQRLTARTPRRTLLATLDTAA